MSLHNFFIKFGQALGDFFGCYFRIKCPIKTPRAYLKLRGFFVTYVAMERKIKRII